MPLDWKGLDAVVDASEKKRMPLHRLPSLDLEVPRCLQQKPWAMVSLSFSPVVWVDNDAFMAKKQTSYTARRHILLQTRGTSYDGTKLRVTVLAASPNSEGAQILLYYTPATAIVYTHHRFPTELTIKKVSEHLTMKTIRYIIKF
jgi:hypothetical protein